MPEYLPEEEKSIANTVDPWGLAFSDQLVRFRSYFSENDKAPFCLGLAHDLIKIYPNKYWFRGSTFPADIPAKETELLWAAAGEVQSFQVAVLPRIGTPESTYCLNVKIRGTKKVEVQIFREVFVKVSDKAAYPRFSSIYWPDPLIPETKVHLKGLQAGVFWVDIKLPEDLPASVVKCEVSLTSGKSCAQIIVPIHVVLGLKLKPKDYPFVGWFRTKRLTSQQRKGMYKMVLAHHMQPIDALKTTNPEKFDSMHDFLTKHGQNIFELDLKAVKNGAYQHIKKEGWLARCVIYSNADEPDSETFQRRNVPYCKKIHKEYPGLRVYLASDFHPHMEEGCDIWLTDLSASGYNPEKFRKLRKPELWHYYCHLPIRWQMRTPLVLAPNMQIDNSALEHRIAFWISRYYGAQGVFLYAGFMHHRIQKEFWQTLTLSDKFSPYPYAGVHNGNGFIAYPPREPSGPVLPSLRLKIIRDALEDLALLRICEQIIKKRMLPRTQSKQLRKLLDPKPDLFVNTHYFNALPETLLNRRKKILQFLAQYVCDKEGKVNKFRGVIR